MVQLFRNSNPAIFIVLIIYGLILKIPAFIHQPQVLVYSPYPLTDLVIFWINKFDSSSLWLQSSIALLMIFTQAFYFNYFLNDLRFIPRTTFLPAFIYVLLSCLFNELSFLSPQLLSLCFLLPSVHNVFLFYKRENASGLLLNTGFLLGIATLFYFPAIIFLIFLFISLLATRQVNIREWTLCFIGFLLPFIFIGAFLYWTNNLGYINTVLDFSKHYFSTVSLINVSTQLIVTLVLLFFMCIWSIWRIRQNFFKTLVQWRMYVNITFLMLMCAVICMVFGLKTAYASLWFIIVPLSALIAYNFAEMKRVRWAEYAHLLVILLIITFNFKFLIGK